MAKPESIKNTCSPAIGTTATPGYNFEAQAARIVTECQQIQNEVEILKIREHFNKMIVETYQMINDTVEFYELFKTWGKSTDDVESSLKTQLAIVNDAIDGLLKYVSLTLDNIEPTPENKKHIQAIVQQTADLGQFMGEVVERVK